MDGERRVVCGREVREEVQHDITRSDGSANRAGIQGRSSDTGVQCRQEE
jgi:hypothetical protein